MFPVTYFPPRYFASHYWPEGAASAPPGSGPSAVLTQGFGSWSSGTLLTLGFGGGAQVITITSYLEYTAPLRNLDFASRVRNLDYQPQER